MAKAMLALEPTESMALAKLIFGNTTQLQTHGLHEQVTLVLEEGNVVFLLLEQKFTLLAELQVVPHITTTCMNTMPLLIHGKRKRPFPQGTLQAQQGLV